VGDEVGASERLGGFQAAAEGADVGDDLVGPGVAAAGTHHGDAAPFQGAGQGLGVLDDLGHVDGAEGQHFGGGDGQGGNAVDLVGGGQHGEHGVGQGFGEFGGVPGHDPALGPAPGLSGRTGEDAGAFAQGILELPAGDEAELVGPVEEQPAAPGGDDLRHLPAGQGEQGHGHAQGHQPGPFSFGPGAEGGQV